MKNRIEINIAGIQIVLKGEYDEEYMHEVAEHVNKKVAMFRAEGANSHKAICLAACDITDEYNKAVSRAGNLRQEIGGYVNENNTLKRQLSEARAEIVRMEKREDEHADEIQNLRQLKERIFTLEHQVAEGNKRDERIEMLETQLSQADVRVRAFQDDADKRTRRIQELEQSLAQAEKLHRDDMEEAEKRERYVRSLKDQLTNSDQQRKRVDELESALTQTERELNEIRSRLARILK